jgi:hypothetical protein
VKLINVRRWAKVRERGRWHFVLVRGALVWGVAMAALNAGLWYWQFTHLASIGVFSREAALAIWRRGTLLSTPVWLVGGAACFLGVWHLNEFFFRRATRVAESGNVSVSGRAPR